MSQPPESFTPPDFSGQTRIMFFNEGNPVAMLVTKKAGRRNVGGLKFATAEQALAWCRENSTMMVYCPVNLAGN